jgi:hypothetical protein
LEIAAISLRDESGGGVSHGAKMRDSGRRSVSERRQGSLDGRAHGRNGHLLEVKLRVMYFAP